MIGLACASVLRWWSADFPDVSFSLKQRVESLFISKVIGVLSALRNHITWKTPRREKLFLSMEEKKSCWRLNSFIDLLFVYVCDTLDGWMSEQSLYLLSLYLPPQTSSIEKEVGNF